MVVFVGGRVLNDRGAWIDGPDASIRSMESDGVALWLEGAERAREKLAAFRFRGAAPAELMPDEDWDAALHLALQTPWPCPGQNEFDAVWSQTVTLLERQGLAVGRGAYGGWDDADRGFGRAAWCLTRHLAPLTVVETGVARGLTTCLVLRALEFNGAGRLYSIDLPPWRHRRELSGQAAAAVPSRFRGRWTLVAGSSRRRLPGLLEALNGIDLFIHDSSHSYRNMSFELARAWSALRPGGFLL